MTDDRFTALAVAFLTTIGISNASAEIRIGVATPLTGPYAWNGEQTRVGADMAVQDLNDRGGVLGESLVVVLVDDFCDPDQALAAANKLVTEGVPVVVGHQCSGAAIPASSVYEDAGIILISPGATNPRLTERGLRYTFRTSGRDDLQGALVGDYLAKEWPGAVSPSSTTARRTAKALPRKPEADSMNSAPRPRWSSGCNRDRPNSAN
jgi:branched-chain amino acid transport system substrate-binding protein